MKKVIFVAFSDIHLHDWPQYSIAHNRLMDGGLVLKRINYLCDKHKCNALFIGDLIHNPLGIDNRLLNLTYDWFFDFKHLIYCISGNHDQCEKNSWNNRSPNYIQYFSRVHKHVLDMDHKVVVTDSGIELRGVPYMVDVKYFLKAIPKPHSRKSILMIHQTLPGAKEPNGYEVENEMPKELYKKLSPFGLVLCGHIHKPQKIFKNTYIVGATNHQRISDMGCKMGCYLIFDDLSVRFVSLGIREFRNDDYKVDKGNMHIPKVKEMKLEEAVGNYNPNNSELELAKEYLKTKRIDSKAKERILVKYLRK